MFGVVNWTAVGTIIGGLVGFLTILTMLFMWQFGRWSEGLGERLDKQDKKIEDNTVITAATASAVARMEGWLAAMAGKPYSPKRRNDGD